MNNKVIGSQEWAFSGGNIPLKSTGKEPEFVSQDKIAILNPSKKDAVIKLTIFYHDQNYDGEYTIEVKAERVRKIRINDLIDPHAIPLGVSYGGYMKSNVPVVGQFTKQITANRKLAIMGGTAYSESKD